MMNHIQIKRTNTIFILRIWTNGSLFFIKIQLPFSELFARRLYLITCIHTDNIDGTKLQSHGAVEIQCFCSSGRQKGNAAGF